MPQSTFYHNAPNFYYVNLYEFILNFNSIHIQMKLKIILIKSILKHNWVFNIKICILFWFT